MEYNPIHPNGTRLNTEIDNNGIKMSFNNYSYLNCELLDCIKYNLVHSDTFASYMLRFMKIRQIPFLFFIIDLAKY